MAEMLFTAEQNFEGMLRSGLVNVELDWNVWDRLIDLD